MNTEQLCEFLGLTKEGLRSIIKRGQLAERLLKKGYRLLSVEKKGRSNYYNLQEIAVESWEEIRKREFPNIRKVMQLDKHCEERLVNGTVLPKEIIKKTGVTRQTSERWDGLLVEKGLMSQNGYSYYYIGPNKELQQITYGEYISFWSKINRAKLNAEEIAEVAECEDGQVTAREIQFAKGGICVKVKSYLVHKFTEKYAAWVEALEGRKVM